MLKKVRESRTPELRHNRRFLFFASFGTRGSKCVALTLHVGEEVELRFMLPDQLLRRECVRDALHNTPCIELGSQILPTLEVSVICAFKVGFKSPVPQLYQTRGHLVGELADLTVLSLIRLRLLLHLLKVLEFHAPDFEILFFIL